MKRTHALVLCFALLFGSALAFGQQQGGIAAPTGEPAANSGVATETAAPAVVVNRDRAQIQSLVQQLDQAALTNDAATFKRLLAPNYEAINAQGVKQNRDTILHAHDKNQIKYESIQMRDQDIQVNGDSAVERNTADVKGTYKGQRFDGTYASTRTFQRQPDGSWRIVRFEVHKVS
jgi:uncharacterized protein (TIGR02246 family)